MIFKLINQLLANPFHLGGLHPYNADAVFKVNVDVSIADKKRFCIFLDLVRSLKMHAMLKNQNGNLFLFGVSYPYFDEDQLMKILADNIPNTGDYFNFVFKKIENVESFKSVINKLDEQGIMKLFEDAEQRLHLSE